MLATGVDDLGTSAAFDRLAEDYRRLYADAAAVTTDRRAALAPLAASSVDTADEEEIPPPATAPRWVGRLTAVLRRSRRVPPGAGESGSVPHMTTTADSRDH